MRKTITLLCLLILLSSMTFAQSGKVFDNLFMKSKILKSDRTALPAVLEFVSMTFHQF